MPESNDNVNGSVNKILGARIPRAGKWPVQSRFLELFTAVYLRSKIEDDEKTFWGCWSGGEIDYIMLELYDRYESLARKKTGRKC